MSRGSHLSLSGWASWGASSGTRSLGRPWSLRASGPTWWGRGNGHLPARPSVGTDQSDTRMLTLPLAPLLREPSKNLLPSHSPQAQGSLWCSAAVIHRPLGLSKLFSGSPVGLAVSGLCSLPLRCSLLSPHWRWPGFLSLAFAAPSGSVLLPKSPLLQVEMTFHTCVIQICKQSLCQGQNPRGPSAKWKRCPLAWKFLRISRWQTRSRAFNRGDPSSLGPHTTGTESVSLALHACLLLSPLLPAVPSNSQFFHSSSLGRLASWWKDEGKKQSGLSLSKSTAGSWHLQGPVICICPVLQLSIPGGWLWLPPWTHPPWNSLDPPSSALSHVISDLHLGWIWILMCDSRALWTHKDQDSVFFSS